MITSTSNPRIKEARKLSEQRYRKATGRFLVEGVRLIDDALKSGVRPFYTIFAPETIQQNAAGLVKRLEAAGIPCLPTTPALLASLAATVTPQGVVAVLPLPTPPVPRSSTLTLVLDRVREPGNAGTLLRTAEAAGVELVVFTPDTVDPYNDKVVRAGMGAHFRLPIQTSADWASVWQTLPAGQPLYLAAQHAELAYDQVDWHQPAVLVVGGEAAGASDAVRARATPIAIPMLGRVESLNAAVAGAVILFEAARQRRH